MEADQGMDQSDNNHDIEGSNSTSPRMQLNQVIVKYMREQLRSKGYDWTEAPSFPSQLDCNEERIVSALICLSENMMNEYGESIRRMTEDTPAQDIIDYDSFVTVAAEVLSSGIQWSHIVTLLAFAAELAFIRGGREGNAAYVSSVTEWVTRYFTSSDSLNLWIESHGGWNAVVSYGSQDTEEEEAEDDDEEPPASGSRNSNLLAMIGSSVSTIFGFFSTRF